MYFSLYSMTDLMCITLFPLIFKYQAAVCLMFVFPCKLRGSSGVHNAKLFLLTTPFYSKHLNIDEAHVHDSHYTSQEKMRSNCEDAN